MKNLQEATERICELKGSLVALDALVPAVIDALSDSARATLMASFDAHAEAARTVMLHADISEVVLATFERDVARDRAILVSSQGTDPGRSAPPAIDGLLLATRRLSPFAGPRALPGATGFFFRRGERLFLATDRRVFAEPPGGRAPDRVEVRLHTDLRDLTRTALLSLPLHVAGRATWREGPAGSGGGGVALLEIPVDPLPADALLQAFDASHLEARGEVVALGDPLIVVGCPDGGHDTLNHLAVARGACVGSAFGVRYRGEACFLTEGRTSPGMAGAPVVRRRAPGGTAASAPAWQLVGVQAGGDGTSGPDRAWYADVLLALSADD